MNYTFTEVTDTLVRCDECHRTMPKRIMFKHRHVTDAEAKSMARKRKDYGIKTAAQFEHIARTGESHE